MLRVSQLFCFITGYMSRKTWTSVGLISCSSTTRPGDLEPWSHLVYCAMTVSCVYAALPVPIAQSPVSLFQTTVRRPKTPEAMARIRLSTWGAGRSAVAPSRAHKKPSSRHRMAAARTQRHALR